MTINKLVLYIAIISSILIIGIPTVTKTIQLNNEKKYTVINNLVIEKAKKCIYDGKCKKNIVTLKELYDNEYLKEVVVNPVSKAVYNENSYIEVKKSESKFYPNY